MSASSDSAEFKHEITADPSKFEAGVKQAAAAAASATKDIDAQFKKIGDTVNAVNKYLMGFTAVLAGGGALKKFISDANEWNGTAGKMAAQLGITSQQASVLNVALARLGIDSDTYVGASQKLSKQIQSNSQAFDVLGVAVRDTTGAYRPVTEVMADVNSKLAAIKNPIEQNIAGQQVYGKGWAEVRGILRLTAEQMQASEKRARDLGLIVGPEGVAMSKQYTAQMRDLGLVGKSLEVQFGNALLPVFTRLGSFMATEGPAMGRVFSTVLESIGFAAAATWLALKDMGDGIGAIAAQAAALLSGDIAAFRAIGKARDEEAAKNEAAYERLKANFGKGASAEMPAAPDLNQGPRYKFKEKTEGGAAAAEKSRMPEWEAALAQQKAVLERGYMMQGQYREMTKAEELSYWREMSAKQGLSAGEQIALSRKTAEVELAMIKDKFEVTVKTLQAEAEQYKHNTDQRLRIEREIQSKYSEGTKEYEEAAKRIAAVQRQAAEQAQQVAQLRVQASRDAQLGEVAVAEQAAEQAVQLGVITQAQLLDAQQAFEQRRNAIAAQALAERLQAAQADPDRNIVELQRIHGEQEQLERQHQLRMGQLRNQATLESTKGITQTLGSVQASWASLIKQLATGAISIGGFVRGMFSSLAQAVIETGAKMVAQWMVQKLAMKLLGKATALSGVSEEAAKAGAGGVASMAAAPFPLNMAAPAFGAAMSAAAMAFMPLASAAGGYDIPGTLNPIVQTHAREMILPAKYADVIRDMAAAPAAAAQGEPAVVLRTMGGIGDFLMVHRHDLGRAMDRLNKDRHRR